MTTVDRIVELKERVRELEVLIASAVRVQACDWAGSGTDLGVLAKTLEKSPDNDIAAHLAKSKRIAAEEIDHETDEEYAARRASYETDDLIVSRST